MKIAGRTLGPGHPCFIVAEISSNHMGSPSNAYKLIDCAWWAGADAVKLQAFTLEEILSLRGEGQAPPPWDAYTKRELYTQALTPLGWLPGLFNHARGRGIIPFSSVFGPTSLAALEAVDCPAYKIAKPDAGDMTLAQAVVATGKGVVVSYGDGISGNYANADLAVLHCPPGYPTPLRDVMLPDFAEPGGWERCGLSSHCLVPELAVAAVARGASILEYHLKLNATRPLDDAFSHTPQSFKDMVDAVRQTEALCHAA